MFFSGVKMAFFGPFLCNIFSRFKQVLNHVNCKKKNRSYNWICLFHFNFNDLFLNDRADLILFRGLL